MAPYAAVVLAASVAVAGLQLQHARLRSAAFAYWRHRMDASADATRAAVQTWLDRLERDNHFLAYQAVKLPSVFRVGPSQRADAGSLSRTITEFATDGEYRGIWILGADGGLVAKSDRADSLPSLVKASAIEAIRTGERQTAGPLTTHDGEQLFAVIEPILSTRPGKSESTLGAVVLAVDPYSTLFPTVLLEQDGIERARHRLVQHIGSEFVVLTPSSVPVAGPGELRLPWELTPSSGALAASARDTSGALRGIGDVPIIAATRHIPETGWGLIRALDEEEAYQAAEGEFRLDVLFVSTLFLLGLVLSVGIRRRQRTARQLAVADSEARYRLLAKHATDLIIRRNLKGDVLYVSPACRQMLGYDPSVFTSENPLCLVHPDDVETARAAELGAFRNPLSLPVQYRVRRADGSYAWLETTGQPVVDPLTQELTEIVTVSRDISARRAIEEEGARLAQRNALLLESAAEGIFGLDRDGTIIFINPAAERLVGWPAGELLGKSQHALMHHTRDDGTANPQASCGICVTAATGRDHASSDDIFWHLDGTSFPVEYQSTPIREGGAVVGAVVTFRDVSARRRAKLELVRAKEEAEAANAAKSNFLARMSHELRTPLNSVIGFSNVLRKNRRGNLTSQDIGYLERIGTNGVQLLALINDILDLSKIEAGKIALDISTVVVGQLVEDTLVQLGDRRYKDGVSIEAAIPALLGTIDTDAAKLRQVLINLIGNAVKFTHGGVVTVSVDADALTHRPTRIRVSDTGIGIAPDRMAAVFVAFEQADTSTSREYGGTGLGLSISRALCESLGFRLEVESVVGVGTTFTIQLSEVRSTHGPVAPIISATSEFLRGDPFEDRNEAAALVLVIEDDADARELLRTHIEDLGYRVAQAATGVQGLQMARTLLPQLITLDLMMPGMDGWELLKRLAATPELARIPVVIVSSIAGEMQNRFVGAVDWINKPVAHALLCNAITRNIDREEGGVLIIEDDPDARELLMRYVLDEHQGNLRVASDGASALAMLEHHLPDLVLLDLKMPSVDGFSFLETIRQNPRLSHLAVIVVTAQHLSTQQRAILAERTIAVLEKGATLEEDLARVLRRLPRREWPAPGLVEA
jgi:PAS domain S-box-containing protein